MFFVSRIYGSDKEILYRKRRVFFSFFFFVFFLFSVNLAVDQLQQRNKPRHLGVGDLYIYTMLLGSISFIAVMPRAWSRQALSGEQELTSGARA